MIVDLPKYAVTKDRIFAITTRAIYVVRIDTDDVHETEIECEIDLTTVAAEEHEMLTFFAIDLDSEVTEAHVALTITDRNISLLSDTAVTDDTFTDWLKLLDAT